jgi:GrpB-like predicted nucleotidyltransferase (UPF0157 family)
MVRSTNIWRLIQQIGRTRCFVLGRESRHQQDVLREGHAAVRDAAHKRDLAAGHPTDRDAYTKAKTEFVRDALRRA